MKSPEEVLASTTPEVKKLISEILKYETEYKHQTNLSKDNEAELTARIVKLIDREIQ